MNDIYPHTLEGDEVTLVSNFPERKESTTCLDRFPHALEWASARDTDLAERKRASAEFYVTQLLPPATALLPAVTAGSAALMSSEEFA